MIVRHALASLCFIAAVAAPACTYVWDEGAPGIPLEGAPPGHYQVIVVVTDLAAGRSAEAREPFEIGTTR